MPTRAKSSIYRKQLNDIWSVGINPTPGVVADPPLGGCPITPHYSQTLILGVASFYNNRVAYVSSKYATMNGLTAVGTATGDVLILQAVSHGAIGQARFSITFGFPVKSCIVNGILLDGTYLSQSGGYFTFISEAVAGHEGLYVLADNDYLIVTQITPYGGND